jgi:uncharacterized protein YpmS
METSVLNEAALRKKLVKTRWLLYGLVALNIAVVGCVLYLIVGYPSDGNDTRVADRIDLDSNTMAKVEVISGKADLEQVINSYLKRHADGNSHRLSYEVELSDVLQLRGDIELMGIGVQLEIELVPSVTESGDLLLTQKSFKAGGLSLPSTLVLEYARQSFDFPDWISIHPSRKQILAATTVMQTESGMFIRVREFDLAMDKLRFEIWLP